MSFVNKFNVFFIGILLSQALLTDASCIQDIDSENFKQSIEESQLPVFIKLSAIWCPKCQRLEAMIKSVLDLFKEHCVFVTIDIDKNQDFLQKLLQGIFEKHFHIISGFPCVLVFHKGIFKTSFFGFFDNAEDLSKKIDEILKGINT